MRPDGWFRRSSASVLRTACPVSRNGSRFADCKIMHFFQRACGSRGSPNKPAAHAAVRPHHSSAPNRFASEITGMAELEKITIAPGLTFDALVAGAPGAPLVLLLHGFAESMHCWRAQVTALGDMGYRAIAPSQRGYSPTARPDPRDASHYHIDRLMDDAMAIVAAAGYGEARFHLVGHDWGGSIAWGLADRHHARLASLTILSRPHPNAFNRALQMVDGEQASR